MSIKLWWFVVSVWIALSWPAGGNQAQSPKPFFSHSTVESLAKETTRLAFQLWERDGRDFFLSDLAQVLAEARLFSDSMHVLKRLATSQRASGASHSYVMRRIVELMIAAKEFDGALRLTDEIPDGESKSFAVTALSRALGQLPSPQAQDYLRRVEQIANTISDPYRRGEAVIAIAIAWGRHSRIEPERLLTRVSRIAAKCSNKSLGRMLLLHLGWVYTQVPRSRPQIMRDLAAAKRQPEKNEGRTTAIAWTIASMVKAGLFRDALATTALLPDSGPPVTKPAISECGPPPTKMPPPPSRPKSASLEYIAKALADRKRFDESLKIAHSIPDPYFHASALTAVAVLVATQDLAHARDLLGEATDLSARVTNVQRRAQIDTALVKAAAQVNPARMRALTRRAARSISSLEPVPRVYAFCDLAVQTAKTDRLQALRLFEQAEAATRRISFPDHRVGASGYILYQMARARFFDELLRLLSPTGRAGQQLTRDMPPHNTRDALCFLIEEMARSGQATRAASLLPRLANSHFASKALVVVAEALAERDLSKAESLLRDTLRQGRSSRDDANRLEALKAVTLAVARIVWKRGEGK